MIKIFSKRNISQTSHRNIRVKSGAGFTLMETLIYIALFSLLFGGAVISAYNMFEGFSRGQTHIMMQEEGNFLVGKINWALSGAKSVEIPATGGNGNTLSVTKWTSSLNPVIVELNSNDLTISLGGNLAKTLNNTNVSVSNLNFRQVYLGGTNPRSVSFEFILTSKTPNGMPISQKFSATSYIRK